MKKIIKLVSILEGISIVLLTFFLIILLKVINIIPDSTYITITILLILIAFVTSFFLLFDIKNKIHKILKYIFIALTIIIIVAYSYGIYTINKTLHLFNNVFEVNEEVTNYYIITLLSSPYEEAEDLYGKSLAYLANIDKDILDKIKLDLTFQEEENINTLKNKLIDNKVDAILVSGIVLNFYEDDENFSSQIKVLKVISITNTTEDITKKVSMKNTPFNILISGIDTYGDINITSRNDVNIIVSINPNTNEILLTWIPRDYYVPLHGKEGYNDKLTHASYYGMNVNVETIEDILDIDINYYVKVNFSTVVSLVDEIGGIDIDSDRDLNTRGCTIKKGENHLNGECALAYSRERYAYVDGDRHRGRNQQDVITAIFTKLSQAPTLLAEYNNIISVLDGKFATNINMDEFKELIKHEASDLGNYQVKSIQLDGTGSMGKTYTYPSTDLWIMIPDQKTIDAAKEAIAKVLNK